MLVREIFVLILENYRLVQMIVHWSLLRERIALIFWINRYFFV